MSVFSVHLVKTNLFSALRIVLFSSKNQSIDGLIHKENMFCMTLGSPILSTKRILLRKVMVFAQWENEEAVDNFLQNHKTGRALAKGWHVRMKYLRQWGEIDGFIIPEESTDMDSPDAPVVAVTLARMKLPQIFRFIKWGRPVEQQVRDNPNATLSLASTRPPRTVSTFSIWKTQADMVKMVHGADKGPQSERHKKAMIERNRKGFHRQFTTLRFKPIAEYGEWQGVNKFVIEKKKVENESC